MGLKGQREEELPDARRKRLREEESVLYRKSPLSEAVISRNETGGKISLSHPAPLHLPLGSWCWAPGAVLHLETSQKPLGKKTHWYSLHRSPFKGTEHSRQVWRVDLERQIEDVKHRFQRVPLMMLVLPFLFRDGFFCLRSMACKAI